MKFSAIIDFNIFKINVSDDTKFYKYQFVLFIRVFGKNKIFISILSSWNYNKLIVQLLHAKVSTKNFLYVIEN